MRLDKIYTRVGDKGKTLLANGRKVIKYDLRIHAYGHVDELNSSVGLTRDFISELGRPCFIELVHRLAVVQNELFDIGGELATPVDSLDISKQQVVDQISITRLEEEIDAMNQTLPPLANFILPGGHRCISQMHMSRCICRRSERAVCELSNNEEIRTEPQIYLNRLSDWLFVAARKIATDLDVKEILWRQRRKEL